MVETLTDQEKAILDIIQVELQQFRIQHLTEKQPFKQTMRIYKRINEGENPFFLPDEEQEFNAFVKERLLLPTMNPPFELMEKNFLPAKSPLKTDGNKLYYPYFAIVYEEAMRLGDYQKELIQLKKILRINENNLKSLRKLQQIAMNPSTPSSQKSIIKDIDEFIQKLITGFKEDLKLTKNYVSFMRKWDLDKSRDSFLIMIEMAITRYEKLLA